MTGPVGADGQPLAPREGGRRGRRRGRRGRRGGGPRDMQSGAAGAGAESLSASAEDQGSVDYLDDTRDDFDDSNEFAANESGKTVTDVVAGETARSGAVTDTAAVLEVPPPPQATGQISWTGLASADEAVAPITSAPQSVEPLAIDTLVTESTGASAASAETSAGEAFEAVVTPQAASTDTSSTEQQVIDAVTANDASTAAETTTANDTSTDTSSTAEAASANDAKSESGDKQPETEKKVVWSSSPSNRYSSFSSSGRRDDY